MGSVVPVSGGKARKLAHDLWPLLCINAAICGGFIAEAMFRLWRGWAFGEVVPELACVAALIACGAFALRQEMRRER